MIKYTLENWKLLIHILFSTYRFGVNNKWWSDFDSIFGKPFYKRTPTQILQNYRGAKFRAVGCYFVDEPTAKKLFPWYYYKKRGGGSNEI
jgi:hypothetical protein